METGARIEQTLEHVIARAAGAGAPPLLASALHYAVFPGGHRIRPQLCLAVAQACGDDDPACRRRPLRPPSSFCIALRWCMTTCPVLTTLTRDGASPRFTHIWRADRCLGRRCSDRPGLRDFGAGGLARAARFADLDRRRRRSARQAASSPARPGNAKPPCRLSTTSAPKPGRCLSARPWRAPPRPALDPEPWRRLGERSGRPTRSPTICATCSATRRNLESRSVRTPHAIARTRPPNSGLAAPRLGSSNW